MNNRVDRKGEWAKIEWVAGPDGFGGLQWEGIILSSLSMSTIAALPELDLINAKEGDVLEIAIRRRKKDADGR